MLYLSRTILTESAALRNRKDQQPRDFSGTEKEIPMNGARGYIVRLKGPNMG
jgi:hypothetical protein